MLKNGLYNILGTIVRTGLTFLTIPVLIRLLGVEEYGLWTLVSSVLGILTLAQGGLAVSTTVFLSKDIATNDRQEISQTLSVTATAMLILATLAALILLVGSRTIVNLFPNLASTQSLVAISALQFGGLVIWSRLLQQIFVGIEQAYQRYGLMNLLNTLEVVISNLGMVAIAIYWNGKTLALMQWQVVTSILMLIIHIRASLTLVDRVKLQFIWNRHKGLEIARYSIATWFTSIGSALFQQGDRLIVGSVLGTELLGVYAAITSVTMQINVFAALAVQPLLPRLNSLLIGSRTNLEKQIKQAFQLNTIFALGLGGIFLIFTPLIINFLFGANATAQYTLAFRLATIIYSFYSINVVGYYVLLGIGAANISLIIVFSSGIISLFLIFVGAIQFNLLGAIIANVGFLGTFLCNFSAMKRLKIPFKQWIDWVQPMKILLD